MPVNTLVYEHIMGTEERAVPVLEGDRLTGLVPLEDVRKVAREVWETTMVSEIMTPIARLDVVTPSDNASEALNRLTQHGVSQRPVVQDGALVGIVRRRDIMKWLHLQSELAAQCGQRHAPLAARARSAPAPSLIYDG
ncbi:MAG: CBS domain-containing protein [Ardenticatenaceae bacterium]|nr:CBS domain-containing protein [Ardenticatenaceae bacterium]HBY95109.1 hypothetical protein [Chloroflexota bacterium]